jgi:hypothetical protein
LLDTGFDPADLGRDLLGCGGPHNQFRIGVPVLDVAADASISALTEVKLPRPMACLVMIPNQDSIWLTQLDPTGVKWNVTCRLCASHRCTSGVWWVDRLSSTTWICYPGEP